jgi:transposase
MSARIVLVLSAEERTALEKMAHAPQPYRRRRARALLQIGDGKSAYWVAAHGLEQRVRPDTVYDWLHRYEQERSPQGLRIRCGRGRKPAYFPA